jgi:hypothetical protein
MSPKREIMPSMACKGKVLLSSFPVNGEFILGVYQGSLSPYDILIKYRQKENGRWSRQRTPQHIHWAVDVLIKHYLSKRQTNSLLDHLLEVWEQTSPITSEEQRDSLLDTERLLAEVNEEASAYSRLAGKGEYSVKFLILLAKLLMVQEKTNMDGAYMFRELLEKLRSHSNIFGVIAAASYNGR